MNSLGERALLGLALLGTIVVMVLTLYVMKLKVDSAESQLEAVTRHAKELAQDRDQLASTLTEQRAAQAQLQTTQHDLRREIDVRKRRIQELEDENRDLKAWAGQPLPAAARRLRERPVITGAAAYRDWLSRGNALPTAIDRPAQ